jgi:hypothetical protein
MSQEFNEKLTTSIIKKLGREGRDYVLKHGELPAIPLTNEEMEYVKGGLPFIIYILTHIGQAIIG